MAVGIIPPTSPPQGRVVQDVPIERDDDVASPNQLCPALQRPLDNADVNSRNESLLPLNDLFLEAVLVPHEGIGNHADQSWTLPFPINSLNDQRIGARDGQVKKSDELLKILDLPL